MVALLEALIGRMGNQFNDLREVMNNGFDMMNKGFDKIGDTLDESKRDAHAIVVADDRDAIKDGGIISAGRKFAADSRTVLYADEVDISAGGKEMNVDKMAVYLSNERPIEKAKVYNAVDPAAKYGTDLSINNGRVDNDTMELLIRNRSRGNPQTPGEN